MSSTQPREGRFSQAEQALEEYFALRAAGDGSALSFETFVARHTEIASELRELHGLCGEVDHALEHGQEAFAAQQAELQRMLASLGATADFERRYAVEGEVGKGGMGAVYRVVDRKLDRPLAMKVILGQAEASRTGKTPPLAPRQLARFLNEAKITGQLDHPGIVPVHEVGVDHAGRAYFTMKLVKGRTLAEVFRARAANDPEWSTARALGVLQRVCEALAFAHDRGVIHRDLKPTNVMVGDFGEVYVMDWGLARRLGEREEEGPAVAAVEQELSAQLTLTREGQLLGTPAYMSPEQARGELERIGPAADVYALGAMLYQLLAGHAPYCRPGEQASGAAVVARILNGPPEKLSARSIPPELLAICDKAMAREVEGRYASVFELAQDLNRFVSGRTVSAFETGVWAETKKWIRRNAALSMALAGVLLVSVSGAVAFALKAADEVRAREASDRNAELARENEQRASENAVRASSAAALAEATAQDLKQVSRFQSALVGDADPAEIGQVLFAQMREQFLARARLDGEDEGAAEEAWAAVVLGLDRINPTDLARETLRRGLLLEAVERARSEFAALPEVRAELLTNLSRPLLTVAQDADAALDASSEALSIHDSLFGRGSRRTLVTANAHALNLLSAGRWDALVRHTRASLVAAAIHLGPLDEATLDQASQLGEALVSAGGSHFHLGAWILRIVLALQVALQGADDELTLKTRLALGRYCEGAALVREAETHLSAAVSGFDRLHGPNHPKSIEARLALAARLENASRYEEADALYAEAVAASRQVNGEFHIVTTRALHNRAVLLKNMRRFSEAAVVFEEAVARLERLLGATHPSTLHASVGHAEMVGQLGDPARAEATFRSVLETLRAAQDVDGFILATVLNNLANLLQQTNRMQEAEPYYREEVELGLANGGESSTFTWQGRSGLAQCAYQRGDFAAAAEEFEHLAASSIETFGPDDQRTLRTRFNLAATLGMTGRLDDAAEVARDLVERRTRFLGPTAGPSLDASKLLASIWRSDGRHEEALELFERLEAELAQAKPSDPRLAADIHYEHANALIAAGREEEALNWLVLARDAFVAAAGPTYPRSLEVAGVLGCLLAKQGDCRSALDCLSPIVAHHGQTFGPGAETTIDCVLALARCQGSLDSVEPALELLEKHREGLDPGSDANAIARVNAAIEELQR